MLIKYGLLRLSNHALIYGKIFTLLELLSYDPDQIVMYLTRSFQAEDLLAQLKYQPASAQLALLHRRLCRYRKETVERRQALGYKLVHHFPNGAWSPGCQAKKYTSGFSRFVFQIQFRPDNN